MLKNKLPTLVLFSLGLLLIIYGIIQVIMNDNKYQASGIYENGMCKIYVYSDNNNTIEYFVENDEEFTGEALLENNIAHSLDGKVTFTFGDDNMQFNFQNDYICNGNYKKIKELEKDEYIKEKNTKEEFLYNGVYINNSNGYKIYIYNDTGLKANACLVNEADKLCIDFNIIAKETNVLFSGSRESIEFLLEFDNDKVKVYDYVNQDDKVYSGEYIKESYLTYDEFFRIKN